MSQNDVALVSVSKFYGDVLALHHLNLAVESEEFVVVIEPSG